jgi:hypothetical protein
MIKRPLRSVPCASFDKDDDRGGNPKNLVMPGLPKPA